MSLSGPIIVGGIGGSGTRAVAAILQSLNIYIGDDLNTSLDNLTFTFLFRRPKWYLKHIRDNDRIHTGLNILEKKLLSGNDLTFSEIGFSLSAAYWIAFNKVANRFENKPRWIYQRLRHILKKNNNRTSSDIVGWGWKEPNSHILIDHLHGHFPQLKYIHTIRHGLDMAYSSNQSQLFNWGKMYGVQPPDKEDQLPVQSFRYWTEANGKIVEKRNSLGNDKVYLLNFDKLCTDPYRELSKLIGFLELRVTDEQLKAAAGIPVAPGSTGRFRTVDTFDPGDFREDDLVFLESMGYKAR